MLRTQIWKLSWYIQDGTDPFYSVKNQIITNPTLSKYLRWSFVLTNSSKLFWDSCKIILDLSLLTMAVAASLRPLGLCPSTAVSLFLTWWGLTGFYNCLGDTALLRIIYWFWWAVKITRPNQWLKILSIDVLRANYTAEKNLKSLVYHFCRIFLF